VLLILAAAECCPQGMRRTPPGVGTQKTGDFWLLRWSWSLRMELELDEWACAVSGDVCMYIWM